MSVATSVAASATMPEAVSAAMPVSIAKSFRARFHQAILRTRPLYNRANPAKGRCAQARFRRFVSQIASFPNLPAAEEAPPDRFCSRDATNDAHVTPSASRRTPRHVRHSENSQSVAYSRQKLPARGSERTISPAKRRAKTRVAGTHPCHALHIIFRLQPKPGLSHPQPTADLPKP